MSEENNVSDDMLVDEANIEVTDTQLNTIAQLASDQSFLELNLLAAETNIKEIKKKLARVSEVDLPAAMNEAGMKQFTLNTGQSINIKTDLFASIPKAKKPTAIQWLIDNAYESLVSEDVILKFKSNQRDEAVTALNILRENGYHPIEDQNVNTARVKALIKELTEEGTEIPLDTFGAFWKTRAIIK